MLKLVRTCIACPEQYDVHLDHDPVTKLTSDGNGNTCIGYMRLRHGRFYAEYRGEEVYESYPKGDGIFTPDERHLHLSKACKAIMDAGQLEGEPLYEII